MAKGSPQPKTFRHGTKTMTIMVDRIEVMAWVAKVAGAATRERMRRLITGDHSFPYEGPIRLEALFVFPRPHTQPSGPPVVGDGRYAIGDLDKLIRAVGDALSPGMITTSKSGRSKTPKAAVIKDDRLITELEARKAYADEVDLECGCHLTLRAATGYTNL